MSKKKTTLELSSEHSLIADGAEKYLNPNDDFLKSAKRILMDDVDETFYKDAIAKNDAQEAFENLDLSDKELKNQKKTSSKKNQVLKQIEKAYDNQKIDTDDLYNALAITLRFKEYKGKNNPKGQLNDIKSIIGDTPSPSDTSIAINSILEEVMSLVPEGMTYSEFTKEYELYVKPRNKKSFFARLFGKK